MYLGVDYYPEQWPLNIMDEDLDRMVELGVNIVRIGEFAWNIFEKEESKFDFSYFDMVIDKLKRKGIKVIIGTPTATPPAWLIKKHEDILSVDEDGMKRSFGGRREYCYNSYIYRQYSEKIVREMVKHYSSFENVICYQVDNELGHEGSDMCYCDNCHEGFQKFLKNKHENIDELNKAYGTVFWSQTYNDFTEIPLPLKTITHHNPALLLDFMRFKSVSLNDYAKFQVEIIKKFKGKHQNVTTNIAGGFFDKYFDHEETVSSMDFASYDNYPVWGGLKEPVEPCETALAQDFIRGLKNKNFWIVEELMGAQGHTIIGYLPRPNQAKMWAYQAFAHGCSDMLFFRYRGATFGTEEFCYGIIDQDNRNGRKFKEVKEFFADIKNYKEVINTKIESKIAIVYDYENIWSFKIQPQSDAFSYLEEFKRFYRPFYKLNAHVDVISTKKDF